jgi:CheY-like chemotaxis protein
VVGNRVLVRLATNFVLSHPGSRTVSGGQADIVDFVGSNAVDLVLLDVDCSLLAGFELASHLRAAGRVRNACGYTVLVAATSSECKYLDCSVGGSAIDGVLKMPCDVLQFADRVALWCSVVERKAGSWR